MPTELPSACWCPDPSGTPGQMYWDGHEWHTAIPAETEPADAPTPRRFRSGQSDVRKAMFAMAGLLVLTAVVAVLVVAVHHFFEGGFSGGAAGSSTATASAGAGQATVTIDGQDQNVKGQVVYGMVGDNVDTRIGGVHGVDIDLSDTDPPQVNMVDFENVNAVPLSYTSLDQIDQEDNSEAVRSAR
jgi:hypothetical protein